MGAYLRIYERRVERKLAAEATRGVIASVSSHPLAEVTSDGNVTDRRRLIPALGLREYWYPALPEKKVRSKKPLYWRMLGDELAFFRNGDGKVAAVSDICPHRGASMSRGDCFYKGTISCPYHGATFDSTGECKAFLTEGPDSKMVGSLEIRTYPTLTLRGWVFVWMGQGEPAKPEEDIPPEFFDSASTAQFHTYTYWPSSWILAIENQNDSHNGFYVHRNSLMQLTAPRMRARTPVGPRSKLIADRALVPLMQNQNYYADETGKTPYQLYYPGVNGVWPLGKWRRLVWALFKPWYALVFNRFRTHPKRTNPRQSEEWAAEAGNSCWHLPCAIRVNFGLYHYTRYAVPVSENLSRVIYFHHRRAGGFLTSIVQKAWFYSYFNYWLHYNFSGQDALVTAPCRFWTKENFSPTDSHLILLRKLVTERSRDAKLAGNKSQPGNISSEEALFNQQRIWGGEPEVDLDAAASDTTKTVPQDFIRGKQNFGS